MREQERRVRGEVESEERAEERETEKGVRRMVGMKEADCAKKEGGDKKRGTK